MDKNLENCDLSKHNENIKAPKKVTKTGMKSHKCNQCDFATYKAGNLRIHSKMHSGEKPIKCNQCDYASSWAHNLRTHLKIHSREKSNKCSQ